MRVQHVCISDELDCNNEVEIEACDYINRDDALKIIEHLTKVFEIGEEPVRVTPDNIDMFEVMFPGTKEQLEKLTVKGG